MTYNNKTRDDILFLNLQGDLIGEDKGAALVELINDKINEGIVHSAIDISELRYINSSGIGVLITILTKFRNKGGELVLIKPSDSVSKLLIITKLNAIFHITNSEEEAMEQLKRA